MVSFRNKYVFLVISLILVAWLSVAQLISNRFLLISCLISFLAFVAWSALNDVALPVLLFFLPWSRLLKLRPGLTSFYTIALFIVLVLYSLVKRRNISSRHLLLAVFLMLITIIAKIGNGFSFDNSYILFFTFLMFSPILSIETEEKYDFYLLIIFFALGIIVAAVLAKQLLVFPTIARFISVDSYQGIIRLSGFYGDPNFYSAHISAAMSGAMILILKENSTGRRIVLILTSVVLIYCGFLSVSKSFFLIFFALILLWMAEALFMHGKISYKVTLIFGVLILGVLILYSTPFANLVDAIKERFRNNATTSALTTGRTELWEVYLKAVFKDPWTLLVGKGFSDVLEGEKISHNTLIQIVYQFGLLGTSLLVVWEWWLFKRTLGNIVVRYGMMRIVIVVTGIIAPWFAIDLLFRDEFFLMQFLLLSGIKYIYNKDMSENNGFLDHGKLDGNNRLL